MQNKAIWDTNLSRIKKAQRIAHFGDWELDLATGSAIWSEEACSIYGLHADDNRHTYAVWESFIHPEDIDEVRAKIAASQKDHSDYNFQHRIIRRDGSVRQIHSHVTFESDAAGKPVSLYGVAHDITDSTKARHELSQAEDNLRLILDLIPLSIYARQQNGDYIFGNHIFLKHYGITTDELEGKNLKDFVNTQEELDELISQDKLVLASGKKLVVSEFRQKNHEGMMTCWKITKIPFVPKGQTQKAVLGIAEDITLMKKREEDLLEMSLSIASRNKDLERFSMMVSHDLRGPVATLLGATKMIDEIKLTQEELSLFAAGIKNSLNKLDDIIRVLNDVTGRKDYISRTEG